MHPLQSVHAAQCNPTYVYAYARGPTANLTIISESIRDESAQCVTASLREMIEAGSVRSEGACEILVFVEPNDYLSHAAKAGVKSKAILRISRATRIKVVS